MPDPRTSALERRRRSTSGRKDRNVEANLQETGAQLERSMLHDSTHAIYLAAVVDNSTSVRFGLA